MTVATEPVESELERVERWRAGVLVRAGFAGDEALELAARLDVDVHRAVGLVESGCPPELACLILR